MITCGNCGAAGHRRTQCTAPAAQITSQICTLCGLEKPIAEFYFHKPTNKYRRICRDCHLAEGKRYRAVNADRVRAMARTATAIYRSEHTEAVRAAGREQARKRRRRLKSLGIDSKANRKDGRGGIYFIQMGTAGPVKIGWSKNTATSRLQAIQIGNPERLRILATMDGSLLDETRVHDKFRHLHILGEWHRPEPELLKFIADNGTAWPVPTIAESTSNWF